jgi:hypothetical protein
VVALRKEQAVDVSLKATSTWIPPTPPPLFVLVVLPFDLRKELKPRLDQRRF